MRLTVFLILLGLLSACAGAPPRAPVENRNTRPARVENPVVPEARRPPPPVTELPVRNYTVTGGDTLFSIAWRYGFDYRALASANNIGKPYTIYPGQTLKLEEAPVPEVAPEVSAAKPAARTSNAGASAKPAPAPAPPPKPPAATPTARAEPPAATRPRPSTKVSRPAVSKGPLRWRWPTDGKVVRGFSGTVHKGVDIDGEAGDPVKAVADGKVVYSGSGIVGYGKLLIVKHNDIYLSAYGHNRKLLVNEGDSIRAGQKIAEKGSSATNSVKLHFEIRREGKPVDPIKLLPRR